MGRNGAMNSATQNIAPAPEVAVRFCGIGGQGVILAANFLARALADEGLEHATTYASYGPEVRGTSVRADVCAARGWVAYPRVDRPRCIVAMAQKGYDATVADAAEGAVVLYDPATVEPAIEKNVKHVAIAASQISEDAFGRTSNANLVMLGAASECFGGIDFDALVRAAGDKLARADDARRALEMGREAARKAEK